MSFFFFFQSPVIWKTYYVGTLRVNEKDKINIKIFQRNIHV